MSATPGVVAPSAGRFAVRVLKLAISVVYLLLNWGRAQLRRLQGKSQPGTTVVLYYHSVPAAYRTRFEEQMKTVARRAAAIDVRSMRSLAEDEHAVAITFDDALQSFAENAVPVLERLNLPATVFAVADAMGSQAPWGESYFSPDERVMTVETLCNLPRNIVVGSHTLTHANLVKLTAEDAAREIGESRRRLEEMLGPPVTLFSFPFGAFDDSTVRQCSAAGYERVFTTEPELVTAHTDPFVLGRVATDPWDWRLEFRLKLAGAYCWQPWTRALKNRIRTRFSARDNGTNDNGTTPVLAGTGTAHRSRS